MKFCTNVPDSHKGRRYTCLTCSDEVVAVRVLSLDAESGLAGVAVGETTEGEMGEKIEMVDVLLVEGGAVGDLILVHGGVALARYEEENDDV